MNIRDKRKQELELLVKERTKELETANNELKLRNSELDRFVYSASHDLSSPLKSILGLINVARLESPEDKQLQYLNMMEKSVDKLELFISEVIQYSRNARMPLRFETFNFHQLVSSILTDYQYVPNFNKIKIEIVDEVNSDITADGMRLRIILNNLISNAIKFHRFNEKIVPGIKISISKNIDQYFFSVEDNGRGIQSEYVEKIFEMFFRATEETTGSGLGLYILKETVARLEGRIDVKSQVGLGTVFTVTIPIRQLEYSKALL
jgi:signal transduction histidine kinase